MIDLALFVAAAPVVLWAGYLLTLTVFARRSSENQGGGDESIAFEVIVPAHDEEAGIADTVRNLRALDWPIFRVVVVADNCSDRTAEQARAAGAEVLVRDDPSRRGKGHALAYAFERSAADAVVVVDADTVASPNLLSAFAARIARGAQAMQADYAVKNRDASWRTRLLVIALALFHVLRSLARERLKLSCGLRGNGMCFTRALLREVPHDAFSVVEDVEYGLRLGEAGRRVHYVEEAHVYGEMVSAGSRAVSQRQRWEGGRRQMARAHGLRLLRLGVARRDPVLLDLAMDLLVPPLSAVAAAAFAGLALSLLAGSAAAWAFGASCAAVLAYVVRGWQLSGSGARGLLDLACAPAYVVWKLIARLRGAPREWVRTAREAPAKAAAAPPPASSGPPPPA